MDWQQVTPSTLVAFLGNAHERTTLDLKQDYSRTPVRARYELAKDVTAFANALGGTLLVGAIEGTGAAKGRSVRFADVPDEADLINELTEATRLCLPLPVVEVHRATLSAADQASILGRTCADDARLVIINVQASIAGPIGCLGADAAGTRIDNAHRFPVRTAEGTRYLRPDELPFHMNSHERRTLLQLRQIPLGSALDVWGRTGDAPVRSCRCTLVRVDAERFVAVIEQRNGRNDPPAEVPLTVVRAVWRGTDLWQLAIDGTIFTAHRKDNRCYGFIPLGGLVDD